MNGGSLYFPNTLPNRKIVGIVLAFVAGPDEQGSLAAPWDLGLYQGNSIQHAIADSYRSLAQKKAAEEEARANAARRAKMQARIQCIAPRKERRNSKDEFVLVGGAEGDLVIGEEDEFLLVDGC